MEILKGYISIYHSNMDNPYIGINLLLIGTIHQSLYKEDRLWDIGYVIYQ